ncbi:hypothetical protein [Desulforamulus ruminis]|uniref:hypothetical protein n=1 Tax=Desulforamulus ruminis TaxID=1564 RepID=UPI001651A35D|nr:hypothetical protein [Desulforamulus ruminis]
MLKSIPLSLPCSSGFFRLFLFFFGFDLHGCNNKGFFLSVQSQILTWQQAQLMKAIVGHIGFIIALLD